MEKDIENWVKLADYDIKTADAMFKSHRYLYVMFTCQQAIEKILKALVTKSTKQFPPKTHDLMKTPRRKRTGYQLLSFPRSVDRESMVRKVWIPAQKTTGMTNVASHGE